MFAIAQQLIQSQFCITFSDQMTVSTSGQLFEELRREKRKALMPFVTAGNPDLQIAGAAIKSLSRACTFRKLRLRTIDR
jgi:hypothetical protein